MVDESEYWLPYPERPQYEVSNLGRIRGPQGIRKPKRNKRDGYLRIILGPRPAITRTMHSIVARTFLGEKSPAHCVAHKNAIKDDNRVDNLQYVTYRANMIHRRREGIGKCPLLSKTHVERWQMKKRGTTARGSDHGMVKFTEAQVNGLHSLYAAGGKTIGECARELGFAPQTARSIIAGRSWRHLHPDVTLRR